MFVLRNYPGCTDKLEAFKKQSTDAELIQESDYMLACVAFEQGKENASEVLKEFMDKYPDSSLKQTSPFLQQKVVRATQTDEIVARWPHESLQLNTVELVFFSSLLCFLVRHRIVPECSDRQR
jgi:hypothetical protein